MSSIQKGKRGETHALGGGNGQIRKKGLTNKRMVGDSSPGGTKKQKVQKIGKKSKVSW